MDHIWINETWDKIEKKLKKVAPRNQDNLPYTSVNGHFMDLS